MKKICTLFACFGLCLTLAACSTQSKVDDAALDEVVSVVEKLKDMKSANYEVNAEVKADDESSKFKLYGAFMNTDKTPQVSFTMDIDSADGNLKKFIEYYMTQDYSYINLMDMKQKSPIDESVAGFEDMLDTTVESGLTKEILKPYLKSASKNGDKISLVIDSSKVSAIEQFKSSVGTMVLGETTIDFTITDGFISTISLSVDTSDSETKEKTKIIATVNILDINKVTEIEFPDLSDYTETPIFQ